MSWSYSRRPSYTATIIHQTLIDKALYEHGDCKSIAAVASVSPIFRNSSLGPNLLALIQPTRYSGTLNLFTKVFSPSNTLQFTRKLDLSESGEDIICDLVRLLMKTRYFSRSLKVLVLPPHQSRMIGNCLSGIASLEEVTIDSDYNKHSPLFFLSTLPNLRRLDCKIMIYEPTPNYNEAIPNYDEAIANKLLGDLENNTKLTDLTVRFGSASIFRNIPDFVSTFCDHLCKRLFAKNRLRYLSIPHLYPCDRHAQDFFKRHPECIQAVRDAKMTNLVKCEHLPGACFRDCVFNKLIELILDNCSDEDLVHIGNNCPNLVKISSEWEFGKKFGDFVGDSRLNEDAFADMQHFSFSGHQAMVLDRRNSEKKFARFKSLRYFQVACEDSSVCASLRHLPNPDLLETFKLRNAHGSLEVIIDRTAFETALSTLINLKHLKLHGPFSISGNVLLRSLKGCKQLETLKFVNYEKAISQKVFQLVTKHLGHSLQVLKFHDCMIREVGCFEFTKKILEFFVDKPLQVFESCTSYGSSPEGYEKNELLGKALLKMTNYSGATSMFFFCKYGDKEAYEKYCGSDEDTEEVGTRRQRE